MLLKYAFMNNCNFQRCVILCFSFYFSHYHHEINKYQKRKNKKDKVINTNSNYSPILSLLDNFAVGLYYTTTKLVTITDQLVEVTDCWSTWCHDVSCKEFQLIASNACTHVLSEDFLVQVVKLFFF